MSCTVDSTSGNVGELTDGTFETVADALHLQNSVIGDKKIAPAPEIVAQIIAETERRLKGHSPSLTPTPITEQSELTDRQAVFDTNVELLSSKLREIELLSSKLREITGVKDQLETELYMAKKKYEITMLEQQNQVTSELEKFAGKLENVKIETQRLENQLFEIQRIKSKEIEEYQSQLSAPDEQLQLQRQQHEESISSQETNQKLEQELEKEKGRVAGLMQTNSSLKQYVLARKESSLVDVQRHMEGLVRKCQEGEEDYNKRIHNLEEVLQQEKDGQRKLKIQKYEHERTLCSPSGDNEAMEQGSFKLSAKVSEINEDSPEENVFKEEKSKILEQDYEEDCNPSSIQTQENPDPQSLENMSEEKQLLTDTDKMIPMKSEHERTLCSPSDDNEATRLRRLKLSAKDKDEEPPLGDMLVEDLRFEERSKISKSRKQNIEEEPPVVDILEKKLKLKKQRCQECEELRKKVRELEREKERSEEDYGDVYEAGRLAIISEMEENKKQKDKNAKLEKDVKKTKDENVRLEDEKARLADEKARLADEKARLEKECEELKTCKICLDGEKKIILIPCGHFGLCQNCYSNNNSLRNCPYCKKEITDHVKVFHP